MSCALRVNAATRSRSTSITFSEGRQNGAGDSSPLRFLLLGRAGLCLVLLWSLRGLCGGRFPANAPHPPSGQVKQRHGRTRPHCHPLPWVNLHPRAPSNGLRPASPAGSRRDGQGEAMLMRSATPIGFVFVRRGRCAVSFSEEVHFVYRGNVTAQA